MLSIEEGTLAVRTARKVIEEYVRTNSVPEVELPRPFDELSGVFVTLKKSHDLRGCIGYPYPDVPLREALVDAAIQAATQDPRFPRVRSAEMDKINLEVTVLSEPELLRIKPLERPEHIVIGRDGLIIEYGLYRGLLLPQVPVEQGWNVTDYLENACMKAGLYPDAWVDDMTKVYTFTGQIFEETSPRGEVVEKRFDEMLERCETRD
ncbi:TIGR00296 family protein [Methanocella sp. CWC-04]|uniref:Protein CUJ83_05650 n=1 Tax=Methanooceanicella nereidis TaxID=2052831 RepID=A0AAP2RBM1_9EURY|nr:TIGR00296 family protein [Methanocella sp. CWC-04]MCD1294483.1 TIGR00296 family protein [Methanocella sp. CWC-04]